MINNKFIIVTYLIFVLLILGSWGLNSDVVVCKLAIKDHVFEPKEIHAQANKRIELIIENFDDSVEEFESKDLKREKIIPAHSTIKLMLPPLKPGRYKFFGEFHEETAQGVIIVE
ncbi:cupredoxin-like domain protein [Orientia chuto str. Dubai]|uniref:Cupredoxin-like domain protein n=1 Tax=Orientia chuto str. Dubai TaxID=1359168 RepID=A0A0F3MP09_9RICK|nr:cupredoxin domain-containing protein [Candidatus Orientia mediorientalis]KJV57480.1 cupredoxin-like domain protein [Orientia chuto str. Dubai]